METQTKLEAIFRLNDLQKKGLKKLGLFTVIDLLYYFPTRYGDTSEVHAIGALQAGEKATVFGRIRNLETSKGFRTKISMAKGFVEDDSGQIEVVWFNQPYIAKMIKENALVKVVGMVTESKQRNHKLHFSNPAIEEVPALPLTSKESLFGEDGPELILYPVYSETKGVTSRWIYHSIQKIFKSGILEKLDDPIPEDILKKYSLPTLRSSLVWIHAPQKKDHAESSRKRFAFEEVFMIQLQKQKERFLTKSLPAVLIKHTEKDVDYFISRFGFSLTKGQDDAIKEILSDFKRGHPMSRLLEGDVGSGKTAVAATTAFAVTENHPQINGEEKDFGNFQIAIMAPTEILATQHFESFISLFRHLPISIALITGPRCKKFPSKSDPSKSTDISKPQLLKWVEEGVISILIGTHSLIQKSVKFKNLAYVVIDEQHRFGTKQRQSLARKDGVVPHLLSMTATPIPRTLALTIYGDLDLSLLAEMPSGRKPVQTKIVLPNEREKIYEELRAELKNGRQAYVICPRINEPDPDKEKAIYAKSVTEEAKRLKKDVFQEFEIGIVHSKMTPKAKEDIMADFASHKIDILVSTSVVEVGVNVPNSTLIIIEGAERFGLAQLHQLRGRVIRSSHQAYCYVFAETKSDKTVDRLKAFRDAKNGFELAELDLKLRGSGELGGDKQWGMSDVAMEALRNLKMVEAARNEAREMIEKDPELLYYPTLKEKLESKKEIHFE